MADMELSNLGYLSRHGGENQSPVVHLQCGGDPLSPVYKQRSTDELNQYLWCGCFSMQENDIESYSYGRDTLHPHRIK